MAVVLCCKIRSLPMTRLGVPLGLSFKARTIGNPILENMEHMLVGWKKLHFSKVDRLILLKSMLSSLPTYHMCLID